MPQCDYTDESLVMLTLAGEQSAYEVLVKRHQNSVKASANSIVHNSFLAEDAAQDAFVTAWMKLDSLNDPSKYLSWVCRIAKNCAVSTLRRYSSFLPLESVENFVSYEASPEKIYEEVESKTELDNSIDRLPEKVKKIIHLHYYEGLSIVEIADRMRISVGTVKSQLHAGRKKMRKELCAMNEKYNDTLVERVMKKVEELKLWQTKNSKDGFEIVYKDVLNEVEELPESDKKYHALADVLMRGWWWTNGDKSDATFARIKEAAICGHNEEVMEFILSREESNIPYYDTKAKIEFIRDKQIPELEKNGFVHALAYEYFCLSYYYLKENDLDNVKAYTEKVMSTVTPSDKCFALAKNIVWAQKKLSGELKNKTKERYRLTYSAEELRYNSGILNYYDLKKSMHGYTNSFKKSIHRMLKSVSLCDGVFFDESLKPGESITASDGTTLTFVSGDESVKTPAGMFDKCKLYVTKYYNECSEKLTYKAYYKEGVGIVKYSVSTSEESDIRLLSSYNIAGGTGLLPLALGNSWEYADEYDHEYKKSEYYLEVIHADDKSVIIAARALFELIKYDENSWIDMMQNIRNDYFTEEKVNDMSHAVERVRALAKTKMELAHTKAATSVINRIMDTAGSLNPNKTAECYWNFFEKLIVRSKNGNLSCINDYRWSFELKNWSPGCNQVYCNHIYTILADAGKYLWSDEWKPGCDTIVEYTLYDQPIKTKISCTDGGKVETAAGVFENTLKISFDIEGMGEGWDYRGGNKYYYFADGIGIVKIVNELPNMKKAVFELISYTGVGEGYMPIADGLVRKYEGIGFTDGYYASSEYTYVADDDGDIVIFADKCGIRNLTSPVTMYTYVADELKVNELWEKGKENEAKLRIDINNLKIILHYFGRFRRGISAEKLSTWRSHVLKTVELYSENGEIPPAWLGFYYHQSFMAACVHFGAGKKEEGYKLLKQAFEYYPKWNALPDGELLSFGSDDFFGGVKLIKGREIIVLPDGTREGLDYGDLLNPDPARMYNGMSARRGWEWFDSVRNEDKFKEYLEHAKEIMNEANKG